MIRRPPRSTQSRSSAASDVYKRQVYGNKSTPKHFTGVNGGPFLFLCTGKHKSRIFSMIDSGLQATQIKLSNPLHVLNALMTVACKPDLGGSTTPTILYFPRYGSITLSITSSTFAQTASQFVTLVRSFFFFKQKTAYEMLRSLVGSEMCIRDRLNNVTNYEAVCAKVEDVIDKVIEPYLGKYKIVGVVDPPRSGLHATVIRALRTCKGLDNLIYVACSPESIIENILDLCLPVHRKRKGPPFTPVKCFGVDLFPYTDHYEGVFYLKRLYE
eukprot:TRINITY_DN9325_c0_g1_i5.p1 TRINITY_DN9325_c0_g1~~TRINITY_DN9325_c0_g1_i5.p1  ORF type:complete len:271 (+),score=60.00 TRINITY_DN9325_c0_g1_i5:3-815(+)